MAKKQNKTALSSANKQAVVQFPSSLLDDLRTLIDQARGRVAQRVNTELVMLRWHMGKRICRELVKIGKPEYGSQLLDNLASQLTAEYGRGFDRSALSRIVRLVEVFPDEEIFATMSQKLGWSHFTEILSLENTLQRSFYAEMCRIEGWSVRTLRDKIRRKLFERTAIAKKPQDVAEQELKLLQERLAIQQGPNQIPQDP